MLYWFSNCFLFIYYGSIIVTKAIKQLVHPKLLEGTFFEPCSIFLALFFQFLQHWQQAVTKIRFLWFINSNIYHSTDGVAGKFKGSTVMPFLCILKKRNIQLNIVVLWDMAGLDWARTWPCKFFMFSTCTTLQTEPSFVFFLIKEERKGGPTCTWITLEADAAQTSGQINLVLSHQTVFVVWASLYW